MSYVTRVFVTATLLAGLLIGGAASPAQQADLPQVENAQVQTRAVAGTLAATFDELKKSSAEAAWIGYAVDAVPGNRNNCWDEYSNSSDGRCGTCRLENSGEHSISHATVNQERTARIMRGEAGRVERTADVLLRVQDHPDKRQNSVGFPRIAPSRRRRSAVHLPAYRSEAWRKV